MQDTKHDETDSRFFIFIWQCAPLQRQHRIEWIFELNDGNHKDQRYVLTLSKYLCFNVFYQKESFKHILQIIFLIMAFFMDEVFNCLKTVTTTKMYATFNCYVPSSSWCLFYLGKVTNSFEPWNPQQGIQCSEH